MESSLWFSVLLILGVSRLSTANDELPGEETLKGILFTGYDNTVAPMKPLALSVSFYPHKVVDVNTDDGLITVDFLLSQVWQDLRLAWDPNEFNATDQNIIVSRKMVFLPDMELLNGFATELVSDPEVVVNANGGVHYEPYVRAEVYCDLPARPFEGHICYVRVGPWSRSDSRIQIKILKVEDSEVQPGGQCTLGESHAMVESKIYPCCPDQQYENAILALNVSCLPGPAGSNSASNSAVGGYHVFPYFFVAPIYIVLHSITGLFG
ncbi:Acetylcholine receptor subunit alpha-L1 [Holothuria leucospilota]|uniref:Acetylcholine receptor subunit alpha-L1 n=1 Tax=Holothuria leucospilota TaxID=206669 RepID=A0A9Q1CIS6_HOLLE|nr:Acetylcholine receptor subunit alpha-L1 [Holothuria leucospilota]